MTTLRLAALAIAGALCLSCATMGEPAPVGPPPFQGVRRIALVRIRPDPATARPKDPLDALAESLAARGYETRVVEVGPRVQDSLREVERLHERIEGWIAAAPHGRSGRRTEQTGTGSAEAVRGLGVDAVAMYHRFEDRPFAAFPEPLLGGEGFPRRREVVSRPAGALSLVDRDGNATFLEWGAPGAGLDPAAAVNAAEAIDMLLRVLAGEPEEE